MITVELFLLPGHPPSAEAEAVVDHFFAKDRGVIVNKMKLGTRFALRSTMRTKKIHNLPALEVPGPTVLRKRKRLMLTGIQAIKDWCQKEAAGGQSKR